MFVLIRSQFTAHPKSLICVLLVLFASCADSVRPQLQFREWLGPQTNEKAGLFDVVGPPPVVGSPIDIANHEKLRRYEIDLKVVQGADLDVPDSENPVVTFDGRGFQHSKDFRADHEARYLVGKVLLRNDESGWGFYTLNVRVTDGDLKGAIVHLRDGKIQDEITDPCIAIYRIPDVLDVETGNVPFEVVALTAK